MHDTRDLRFASPTSGESLSAILVRPADARWLYVFAHGAGAPMRHVFMEQCAQAFAERGIATFRYQFPYTERGSARIDPQPVLLDTVRAAITAAQASAPDLPLLAGGKSMGGRMTSLAAADGGLPHVRGIVFVGFPLHPAGQPGISRAKHLEQVAVPMLFLQGTRDTLAGLDLLTPVVEGLGARATLHVVDGADHGFAVLKRSGRTGVQVLEELADTVASWGQPLA